MTYTLNCDEAFWVRSKMVEDGEKTLETEEQEVDDPVQSFEPSYYWITSEDREDVLKVLYFVQGEKVLKELSDREYENYEDVESFEEAEEKYEYAEIQEERPAEI